MTTHPLLRMISAFFAAALAARMASALEPVTTRPASTLQVHVLDPQKKPVHSATIQVQTRSGTRSFASDADGRASLPIPALVPSRDFLRVTVLASGCAPSWSQWWSETGTDLGIPNSLEIALIRGSEVGGTIVNEDGAPIQDATVKLHFNVPESVDRTGEKPGRLYHSLSDYPVGTDARGHWVCKVAPEKWVQAFVQPAHPGYCSSEFLTPVDENELRSQKCVVTMVRGRLVSGRVVAPDGSPISGAVLRAGHLGNGATQTRSAADGHFIIPHTDSDSTSLLAYAPGYGPTIKLLPSGNVKDLEVRMTRAATLHGKVVDAGGKPIPDTYLALTGWEGGISLNNQDWEFYTDAAGRFSFDGPAGVTSIITAVRAGFMPAVHVKIPDDGAEHLIVLGAKALVSGKVTDAKSGKAVPRFRVAWATDDPGVVHYWSPATAEGVDGGYSLELSQFKTHRVRIDAPGYRPVSSAVLQPVDGKYVFDAAMSRQADVSGVVLDSDGRPIPRAKVRIVTPGESGYVALDVDLGFSDRALRHELAADANGRISLPAQDGPYDLLAFSVAGCGKTSGEEFEKVRTVRLAKWSAVAGVVETNPALAESATVKVEAEIGDELHCRTRFRAEPTPDSRGKFAVARVPAGACKVTATTILARKSGYLVETRTVSADDQTRPLNFSLTGPPVKGKVVPAEGLEKGWHFIPVALRGAGGDASYWYSANVSDDGRFELPVVRPGKYRFSAALAVPSAMPGGIPTRRNIAGIVRQIGVDSGALDLGDVRVEKIPVVAVGTVLPDLRAPGLDGPEITLSEFRGKFLVLDFWATWCGPCLEQTDALKSLHDATARDGRLVMLSLSLDDAPGAPRRYVRSHGLQWRQAFLGNMSTAPLVESFAVHSIPSLWLIDPDGKVLANGSDIVEFKGKVKQALK